MRDQSDLYYVGNSSGGEMFAEYIDDLRIYNTPLNNSDIDLRDGFGDMYTSINVEENSTTEPRLFDPLLPRWFLSGYR